ncbi:uncharacterized protein LOC102710869 [Oryza brachyantha]|uniref:uncharacterized protein LOC102710869 n=1 Tax=Oryza brachyantha TaxID=4533 RepID=UPI0003EA902C|nr:uncharacterized protein LOC102710869 [Oryza brachyantha]
MAAFVSDQIIAGTRSVQILYYNNAYALVQLLNAYQIELIVLSSFLLQVVLLFLAGYRRRHDSPVAKSIVLYSYLLADYAATYGLGHLSVITSRPPQRQQLVAFWAPFLLLHLGGPDSITAYSLEDNKLWHRKLLVDCIQQVLGAAYVLYKTFPASSGPLLPAAWLIFSVGVAKYAERIWALYNGNISTIRSAVDKQDTAAADDGGNEGQRSTQVPTVPGDRSPEDLLIFAHSQFQVCKGAMVDSSGVNDDTSKLGETIFSVRWKWEEKWTVFQMELSLLYDIMYTKAGVMHTWHGYCLRVFSPLATTAALLLFHLSRRTSSMGATATTAMNSPPVLVDVFITYALLVGAILLDIVSLMSAAGSGWAYAFLVVGKPSAAMCSGRWRRLHRWLESLRELVKAAGKRKWSGAIGQYNVLQFCVTTSHEKKYSSTSVEIPKDVMEVVFNKLTEVILRPDWKRKSEAQKDQKGHRRRNVKEVRHEDEYITVVIGDDDDITLVIDNDDGVPPLGLKRTESGTSELIMSKDDITVEMEPEEEEEVEPEVEEDDNISLHIPDDKFRGNIEQQESQVRSRSVGPTGRKSSPMNSLGLIKAERGQLALEKLVAKEYAKDKLKRYIRDEIQEGILIWHIATDIYLRTSEEAKKHDEDTGKLVGAINLLSNYLMFLVVERP